MILRRLTHADEADARALYADLVGPDGVAEDPGAFVRLLSHPGTVLLGCELEGAVRAMLTLHILPNMTQGGRPYALIENVVTANAWRGQGLGRAVMAFAVEQAWAADAYKIMLLTGQDAGARGFYERVGFTADEKFGMTLRRAPRRPVS